MKAKTYAVGRRERDARGGRPGTARPGVDEAAAELRLGFLDHLLQHARGTAAPAADEHDPDDLVQAGRDEQREHELGPDIRAERAGTAVKLYLRGREKQITGDRAD